ncbi:hypothetical protein ATANTOWER_010692, partial [Ataeniobius toweri]|nr:hypothetical protein [Ataeniobius toweri]
MAAHTRTRTANQRQPLNLRVISAPLCYLQRQKQRRILLPSLPCSSAALHGRRSPPAMALVTLQRSPTPSAASSASSSAGEDFGSDDDRKNNQ